MKETDFKLLNSFVITVPGNYNHDEQLESLIYGESDNIPTNSGRITDKGFAKVTGKLAPGKSYLIKLFDITAKYVSSEDCLAFLKTQKAILAGAQGLYLVWQQVWKDWSAYKQGHVARCGRIVSFDEKSALWEEDGEAWAPYVQQDFDGNWEMNLHIFDACLTEHDCLIYFCEV